MKISELKSGLEAIKTAISEMEDRLLDYEEYWQKRTKHLSELEDRVTDDETYCQCKACGIWEKMGEILEDSDGDPVCENCVDFDLGN